MGIMMYGCRQLKYVLEVAASSSMREAATKLFVTQPALSASIHELEEDC
ncbi:LysR family transcriptional regulator [Lacrimispora indolis]